LAALANVTALEIQDAPISDKAIEHIKKMPSLSSITIRGSKMSPEALMKLAKEKPEWNIRGQSLGVLGINSGDTNGPCQVTATSSGAPADAAGIIQGDLITKLNGKTVETFGQLTLMMMKKQPGDEVEVTLKRGDQTLVKKLKLGSREAITR
jgi:S1-C subfamily serine protease